MTVLVEQRPEGWICDREALATWLGLSTETVRKRCVVVARTRTGRALYNMEHAEADLRGVIPRPGARAA